MNISSKLVFKTVYGNSLSKFRYLNLTNCLKMPKPGFYAVKKGRVPGIYQSWAECEAQVKGFPSASFKKFDTHKQAEEFIGVLSNAGRETHVKTDSQCPKSVFNSHEKNDYGAQAIGLPSNSLNKFDSRKQEDICNILSESRIATSSKPKLVYSNSNNRKASYYAVHRGITPGVYRTWTECEKQIKTTKNASYRKFENEQEALEYVRTGGIVKASKRELQEVSYGDNKVQKKRKCSNIQESEYFLENPNETVVVFTDGASSQNGKKQCCAGIGVYWGPNHPLNASKRLAGRQTNNRAEIHAAIYALNQAKMIGAKRVKLYTDSQFLIHSITDWIKKWKANGWKLVNGTDVVNKEDFIELEAVAEGLEVEWVYVRAHANNHGNEEADRLAVAGAKLLMIPENCPEFPKPNMSGTLTTHNHFIVTKAEDEALPLILPESSSERGVFYAVHRGKKPGVYKTWTECEQQIKDFNNPRFRKFSTEAEASEFVKNGNSSGSVKLLIPECSSDDFVTVFTDGASSSNQNQEEAKAGIGVYWGPNNPLNTSMRLSGRQTNNRAEIYAAIHALKQAKKLGIKNIRLYTDSKFVINGITDWIVKWKKNNWIGSNGKPVINKDDFMALDDARTGINVDWCYVKGHSNNPGNVEADKLAVAGCSKELNQAFIIA